MSKELQIRQVPRSQTAAAASLLFQHLPAETRVAEQMRFLADLEYDTSQADGLLGAYYQDQILAVCRLQTHPGHTGHLWQPVLNSSPFPGADFTTKAMAVDAIRLLVSAAIHIAKAKRLTIVQSLLPTNADPNAVLLREAGFGHAAELLYLVSTTEAFPGSAPSTRLSLSPVQETDSRRLALIINETYSGSLDCPCLNDARQIEDVLAGYRSVGSSGASLWRFLQAENRDVGCLLVAEHPPTMWEIVYLGVIASARGQNFGLEATLAAQWLARSHGVERLVLAVDAANYPAINLYAKAGFLEWDRRSVFLWSSRVVAS